MSLKKSFGLLLVLLLTPLVLVGVVQSNGPPTISVNLSSYGIYVYGSGWTANADVTVYYDVEDAAHMVANVMANYAGNFQTYIPTNYVATVGAHTVIAVQGADTATAVYSVGVVSPPDDRLLNPILDIKDKLDAVYAEVQAIEAKLDPGGSFYNFVNAWFVTVDDKIDVVDGKVDDVDDKVGVVDGKVDTVDDKVDTLQDSLDDVEDQLANIPQILAYYSGDYGTGGELSGNVIVPGTHIQTDQPVLFSVSYSIFPNDDYLFFLESLPLDIAVHGGDEVRHNSITFSGTSMFMQLWDESDVRTLRWRIMVRGTPGTVVTVIE